MPVPWVTDTSRVPWLVWAAGEQNDMCHLFSSRLVSSLLCSALLCSSLLFSLFPQAAVDRQLARLKAVFVSYDTDHSRSLDQAEANDAFRAMRWCVLSQLGLRLGRGERRIVLATMGGMMRRRRVIGVHRR